MVHENRSCATGIIAKHAPLILQNANLPEGVLSFIPGDVEIIKHLVSHDCLWLH